MTRRSMIGLTLAALVAVSLFFSAQVHETLAGETASTAAASAEALATDYATEVQPLLEKYCHRCHAGDRTEAEIDLGAVASFVDVRKDPRTWQKVRGMLVSAQMPPKKSAQPSDAERARLTAWVRDYLRLEAEAHAGDPGRVVLRRLSNTEYTYTVRDLTGVTTLDPVREFPVDGAAGEGFTNTGDALVMSPSLVTKYLDAAKDIASHAVLLPDGMRFSAGATRRDWSDELLGEVREFYRQFTDRGGGALESVTDESQRLPLEEYLRATLTERRVLQRQKQSIEEIARARRLNAKYLRALWTTLTADDETTASSLLLDRVRQRWRDASEDDATELADDIAAWQSVLWKFNKIGQIGREGGPESWQEAVDPLVERQEFRVQVPKDTREGLVTVYLAAGDAGDGNSGDYVVWKNPRLEGGGQVTVPLRTAAGLAQRLEVFRRTAVAKTAKYLAAVSDFDAASSAETLATRYGIDASVLSAWLNYLDVGDPGPVEVKGHLTNKLEKTGNYDFVRGFGSEGAPSIVANASDDEVRVPGVAKPRSVLAHPSATHYAAAGWQSPIAGEVHVAAYLSDAHPECGNGVEWVLEHRTGRKTTHLAEGNINYRDSAQPAVESVKVTKGALVSLLTGSKGHHGCDLTNINLIVTEVGGEGRVWNLAGDVASRGLDSNPHGDAYGNAAAWHFFQGEMAAVHARGKTPVVPPGSLLASWRSAADAGERQALAARIQSMAAGEPPQESESPDAVLYRHVQILSAPKDHTKLLSGADVDARFGRHPLGHAVDAGDLVVQAPSVVKFRLPAELAHGEGRELVVTGGLDAESAEGSVQLRVEFAASEAADLSASEPVVVRNNGAARARFEAAFDAFRELFPAAVCYPRIVPIDEVVTLTLFYREDDVLQRLFLDSEQVADLNHLWDELLFVSHEPLGLVVAFEQISEFATQDRPDLVVALKPLEKPIRDRAERFRERLVDAETVHLEAILEFANRAWRRALSEAEAMSLRDLYADLRVSEISHEEAIRLTLARVLTSPAFLYRLEEPGAGAEPAAVSSVELASRLSYFLWASMPDARLSQLAAAGRLHETYTLVTQARRMLDDDRTRRLAVEFGCQWLHLRGFDQNDEKNEKLYPEFAALRGDMYEETIRFFMDLFRRDGSILEVLNADYVFVSDALAEHYRIGSRVRTGGDGWSRVDGVHASGRGGVLGMASVLASQSGASRTSPILRGNWVFETLLGERLPRPPANVPQLPDAVPSGLTARQLIESHSSVPECAKCHAKIDPYGFALEQYDALGRLRPSAVDTKTKLPDGKSIDGLEGLRDYLAQDRREDFVRQFCRKLLGYALGRAVQLSDEPLLEEMAHQLKGNGYRFSVAVEAIVTSPQFRRIRGAERAHE